MDAVMVTGVTFCEKAGQLTTGEINGLAVAYDQNTIDWRWRNRSVNLPVPLLAIHVDSALDQPCRIDHVRRAAWVNHKPGVRKVLQQGACAASMIQVHVRHEQVVDISDINVVLLQRIQ